MTAKINSREKGARFERELAKAFRSYGFAEARRGVQYSGLQGGADDVVGLPGIHVEAKHVEKLNLGKALEQAERDCCSDEMAAVFHRKNRGRTYVTMEMTDWMRLYKCWYDAGCKWISLRKEDEYVVSDK